MNALRSIFRQIAAALAIAALAVQTAAQSLPDPELAARKALQIARSIQAIEDGLLAMERDRWDPQFVADTIGPDAEDLRHWVGNNVAWVPYMGALRGGEGVLMDRWANTLDGALLMADLLDGAGYTVRIAAATLDRNAAVALLSAEPQPADLPEEGAMVSEQPMVAAASLYDLDPEAVQQGLILGIATADENSLASLDAIIRQSEILAALTRLDVPEDDGTALLAALAPYYWAQYQDGTGWRDADWLTPDGAAPVAAETTFARTDLPAEALHAVTLRLIVEQVAEGVAQETVLTEARMRPVLGEGRKITLVHMPMDWPSDWADGSAADIQFHLRAAFASQKEWWPLLSVDGAAPSGPSIRADGTLNFSPQANTNPFLPAAVRVAGRVTEAADVLRIGDEPADTVPAGEGGPSETEFTAEWLEFTVELPSASPVVYRRAIFDLVGTAERAAGRAGDYRITDADRAERSLRVMSEADIVILPAALPTEYLAYLGGMSVLANRPVLDEIAADPFGVAPGNLSDLMSRFQPGPGPVEAFAATRFAISPLADGIYADRPQIVVRHGFYRRESATGDFLAVQALDIVEPGVGVDPFSGYDPVLARIVQGVADAQAEAVALGGGAEGNASVPFGEAQQPWRLVTSDADLDGLPNDMGAQIAAALAQGMIAVVPADKTAALGVWWRIDPKTGSTLAMGPDGWGQALVEYAFILVLKALWSQIACAARVASVGALTQAIDKGKVTLPKSWSDTKNGLKGLAKTCMREAMLAQLTGLSTTIMIGLPKYGENRLNKWVTGRDGWVAKAIPPPTMPPVNSGNVAARCQGGGGVCAPNRPAGRARPSKPASPGNGAPPPAGNGAPPPAGNTPPSSNPKPPSTKAPPSSTQSPPSTTRPPPSSTQVPPSSTQVPPSSTQVPPSSTQTPAQQGKSSPQASPAERVPDELNRAQSRAEDAIRRGEEAYARRKADPSPENVKAHEQAVDEAKQAMNDRMREWAKARDGGYMGRPPPLPPAASPPLPNPPTQQVSGPAPPTLPSPAVGTGDSGAAGGFASTLAGLGALSNAVADP